METINISAKDTFRNLGVDKQRRITAAAVNEFAEYGYEQASVNRIVRETGIAKGSLYQYFAGKEGLYLHVFTDFIELVKKTVKDNEAVVNADLFDRIRLVINAGLKFIRTHPQYFRLYCWLLSEEESPYREELLAQVRFFPTEYFAPLVREGQDKGMIRKDIPAGLMVFMIDAVLERFLLSSSNGQDRESIFPGDAEKLEIAVEQIIKLLESGMAGKTN